jgi:hypothetical protein
MPTSSASGRSRFAVLELARRHAEILEAGVREEHEQRGVAPVRPRARQRERAGIGFVFHTASATMMKPMSGTSLPMVKM